MFSRRNTRPQNLNFNLEYNWHEIYFITNFAKPKNVVVNSFQKEKTYY